MYRKYQVSIRTYEPAAATNEQVGLIYMNQIGSAMSEDAGRDATYLANHFELPVIGADRPGTGLVFVPGLRRAIDRDYVDVMCGMARKISKEADRAGIDTLVANARSAGALGILALTRTELLPIKFMYAAEPVGFMTYESTKVGHQAFKDYNRRQKEMIESDDPDMVRPDSSNVRGLAAARRVTAMLPLFLADKYHTGVALAKPESQRLAEEIAAKQPDVDATIEFASFSMMDLHARIQLDRVISYLPELREDGEPFTASRVPNTVHASFDKRSFYASRLDPIVNRALAALVV